MPRKLLAMVIAAAIGATGAAVQVLTQQQARTLEIERVKDDLYVITGPGGNVAARITPEGVILVDDKFEQDYEAILEKVRTITSQPVKYVLNTHHHGDHTGSNAQFLQIAEVISHKNARENMVRGDQPGMARIVFTEQTAVFLGGAEVQAHYLGRGHTNGDAVIYYPDLRVIHTGDLINEAGPFADYNNGASVIEWVRTFDEILELDFDTAIPGHGGVMTKAEVQEYRDRMDTLIQRLTTLIREGTPREEIAAKLRTDDLVWNLGPDSSFMSRSLNGAYDEIASQR